MLGCCKICVVRKTIFIFYSFFKLSSNSKVLKKWITEFDGGCGIPYTNSTNVENIYITKVIKTGNSLSVVIPKSYLRAYNLQRGDQVIFGSVTENIIGIHKLNSNELLQLKNASAGAIAT